MASPYKGRFRDCGSCEGRGEYPCSVCRGGSVDCERCVMREERDEARSLAR